MSPKQSWMTQALVLYTKGTFLEPKDADSSFRSCHSPPAKAGGPELPICKILPLTLHILQWRQAHETKQLNKGRCGRT